MRYRNGLLAAMLPEDLALIEADFSPIALARGELVRAGNPVEHCIFLETGLIIATKTLGDGKVSQCSFVPPDGMYGVLPAVHRLDDQPVDSIVRAPFDCRVTLPGHGWAIAPHLLCRAMRQSRALHQMLYRLRLAAVEINGQIAVCNGAHSVLQRITRRLLLTRHAAEDDCFPVWQIDISQTLGINESTVSQVFCALADRGLLRREGHHIRVLDAAGLEAAACPCYRDFRTILKNLVN